MSHGYKHRKKAIKNKRWDFAHQDEREQHKFFRHMTEAERDMERHRGSALSFIMREYRAGRLRRKLPKLIYLTPIAGIRDGDILFAL